MREMSGVGHDLHAGAGNQVGDLLADGSIVWRFRSLRPDRTIAGEKIRLSHEALARMCQMANMLHDKLTDMKAQKQGEL